ncbi:MAG: hypothetical protein IPN72_22670 [Saprospiraceae bacterium]|nr:hypothetical protein [Saprospiraceae bacterium]
MDILLKASNGASDFGNKFCQPLIEVHFSAFHIIKKEIKNGLWQKVIMMAGGVGFEKEEMAQ